MKPDELPSEEREARRLKPAVGLGAAAFFFLALFAWSELRLRALREDLNLLSATNRQLLLQQQEPSAEGGEKLAFFASAQSVVPMVPTAAAGSAAARVFRAADGAAMAVFTGLPPIRSNGRYVVWAIGTDGKPRPLASFVPAEGMTTVPLESHPPSDLLVTREEGPVAHSPSTAVLFNLPLSTSS